MLYRVDPEEIALFCRFDRVKLVRLIKKLLETEAKYHGISIVDKYIPENITVPDGGEDGFIEIDKPKGKVITNKLTCLQFKTSKMEISDLKKEVIDTKTKRIKKRIAFRLIHGGSYYLFCSEDMGAFVRVEDQEKFLFDTLQNEIKDLTPERVKIFDNVRIADIVNNHPEMIFHCKKEIKSFIPQGLKLFDQVVEQFDGMYSNYIENDELAKHKDSITTVASVNKNVIRIVGEPGTGKTRLVVEAFRNVKNRKNILYFEVSDESNIMEFLESYYSEDEIIIILDNCNFDLYKSARGIVKHASSRLRLISINSDQGEIFDSSLRFKDHFISLTRMK
jgi:hypothetical protein